MLLCSQPCIVITSRTVQQAGRWHLSSLGVYFGPESWYTPPTPITVQACNDLGQNSRAGGPKAAGTTLGWPLGSRGEWVRRLPYYRLSCSIRAFGSPPRGLAFGLPSVTDTAVGCSRTSAPSLHRGGVVSSPRPRCSASSASAPLRPSGLGSPWYFRTPPC